MAARKTTAKKPATKPATRKSTAKKSATKRARGGTKGKGTRDGSKRKPKANDETFKLHDHFMEIFHTKFINPETRGKKRLFDTPEAMAEAMSRYFTMCEEQYTHPTITGLSLSLGFNSLNALNNYEGYDDGVYHSLIKYAKHMVEHSYEKSLIGSFANGARFALTNIARGSWAEKSETKLSGGLNNTEKVLTMSPTERQARLKTLLTNALERKEKEDDE